MCLFLFLAFRDEGLEGKVSWQLIPGQRVETACYSHIRNHLCTLTLPLNLRFTDTLSPVSPSISLHLSPPVSSLFVLLFRYFSGACSPPTTSADDQEVSAGHCLSFPPHSLARSTESIVNC